MIITLKDGSKKEYDHAVSVLDIASDISEGLARMACAGEVDGQTVDLRTVVDSDCELSILTFNDEGGKAAFRHTASHIMAQAIKRLYPDAKLAIGPSVSDGFYYDIDRETPLTAEDLEKIEAEMKKIVKESLPIERFELPREEAIAFMKEKEEPYKVELIEDLPEDAVISFYKQGEFTDLCAGPHLMTTKPVKAFKLTSIAGAYWRGSEKNKMLTRIYGTAFTKKADLEEHLARIEEAKKNGEFPYEYGVTNIPNINEELKTRSLSVTNAVVVNGYSQKKDIANEFAAYLTGERAQNLYERTGRMPARKGVSFENPQAEAFGREYALSVPIPKMMATSNYWCRWKLLLPGYGRGKAQRIR